MGYQQHQKTSQQIIPNCAVITLSDSRTRESDKSGLLIQERLIQHNCKVVAYEIIPDEPVQLKHLLNQYLSDTNIHAIITNGGTGIAKRDQTIDVIQSLIQIPLPGFGEIFRMLSYQQIQSGAILSRAIAGICNQKPIFAIPGSTKAVELGLEKLIIPELRHILSELGKST